VVFETWKSGTYASWLTILDAFIRESLAIEIGQRLKGEDVVGVLNQIRGMRGSQCWMVQPI
jgi:putative transposase